MTTVSAGAKVCSLPSGSVNLTVPSFETVIELALTSGFALTTAFLTFAISSSVKLFGSYTPTGIGFFNSKAF